jgi:hypothetical protein
LIQEGVVLKIAQYLPTGALIYLSSDSNRVALWMVEKFLKKYPSSEGEKSSLFRLVGKDEVTSLPPDIFLKIQKTSNEMPPPSRDNEDEEDRKSPENDLESEEENHEEESDGIRRYEEYWMEYNPLGELSERELVCEVDWRRVKRCVLERL